VLLIHALEIPVPSNAEQRAAARCEWESVHDELQIRWVNPAVALRVGAGATRAVARAEARVACDKLDAGQPAVAAARKAVGQVLPEICGRVVRPTLPVRAELASSFEAEVLTSASSRLCLPCGPLSPAIGTTQRRREAKGKVDFRGGLLTLVTFPLKRESREGYRCRVERSETSQIVVLWFAGRIDRKFFASVRMAIPLTTIYRFNALTNHVPSVRGLSPPAIDSRMEVSA